MKKILLLAVMAVASISLAVAQPRAIGGNVGYSVGFSYQHNLGESNMIDLAVDVPFFDGVGASCTYDWIDPFGTQFPWDKKGEWHWSLGVGAGAGYWGFWSSNYNHIYAGAVGHCGVMYDFWFPLELSVDYRPNIGVDLYNAGEGMKAGFNISGLYSGITLGVRYKF